MRKSNIFATIMRVSRNAAATTRMPLARMKGLNVLGIIAVLFTHQRIITANPMSITGIITSRIHEFSVRLLLLFVLVVSTILFTLIFMGILSY